TLNSDTFTVTKVYSDASSDPQVGVSLACDEGGPPVTVTDSPQTTTGLTADFTVTGWTDATQVVCTATETSVPPGYNSSGTCAAALSPAGGCTITNTLNSGTFTVTKQYSDASTDPQVEVSLACVEGGSPVTVTDSPQTTTGLTANFTVTGWTDATQVTCTATETSVPPGYSSSGTCAAALSPTGACTIVNTLNTGTFTVTKVYSDASSDPQVEVSLDCDESGSPVTVTDSPQTTTGLTADFTVTGWTDATQVTCTATETS
ncbi:unnamed protein product, partial [marine sediment metagenome]